MVSFDNVLIRVHDSWNGWHSAEVQIGHVTDVQWFQPARAPHPLLHAWISCADIISGEIPHECDPASAPHPLMVCLLKKHVLPAAYAELVRRAEMVRPSPPRSTVARVRAQRDERPQPRVGLYRWLRSGTAG